MSLLQPLRILHLTSASETGGLSRYLLDLCGGLKQRGHHAAIAGERGGWHDRFVESRIPWINLPLRGGPLVLRQAAKDLSQYLASHPVDVLHAHYRKASLVARWAARGGRPPILYTVHLSGIPLGGPWRWLSDFGDQTHAPSQGARRWLLEKAKVPDERITVIPHGVEISRFPQRDEAAQSAARHALRLSQTATVAAFAGRLDFPKNADWMIDLAEQSRSLLHDLQIILAGDGPDAEELRRIIRHKNLVSRLRMLGERDVLPVYQAADALLLPSLREGFGLVCAEAMCVGVPVLRTRTSGTEELIVEGVTGRSVPINRKSFVAAAIEFLSDRPALATQGRAAAEYVRRNFTLDRQIDATIELYRRMQGTAG